jgi:hypothetical protein
MALEGEQGPEGYVQPGSELSVALLSGARAAGLHLGLRILPALQPGEQMTVALRVNLREITLTRGLDGIYRGRVESSAALFGEADRAAEQRATASDIALDEPNYRKFIDTGFDVLAKFPAPKPGPYQIRAAAIDSSTGRAGASAFYYEAPELRAATPAISGLQLQDAPEGPPRTYARGHDIPYSYEVANLHRDAQNRAVLEVTSQILHSGEPVYTSKASRLEIALTALSQGGKVSGVLRIGSAMTPGPYRLRVTVVDTLAPGDPRPRASQDIDFEVR